MRYKRKARQLRVLLFLYEGNRLVYDPGKKKPTLEGLPVSINTLRVLCQNGLVIPFLLREHDREGPFRVEILDAGITLLKEIGLVDDGKHHHIPNRKGLGKGRKRK